MRLVAAAANRAPATAANGERLRAMHRRIARGGGCFSLGRFGRQSNLLTLGRSRTVAQGALGKRMVSIIASLRVAALTRAAPQATCSGRLCTYFIAVRAANEPLEER